MSAVTVNLSRVKKVRVASSIALVVSIVGALLTIAGFHDNLMNVPASVAVAVASTLLFAASAAGLIWVNASLGELIISKERN